MLKISLTYAEYKEYSTIPQEGLPIPRLENFYKHLILLRDDRSHITLKLRQILNCVRFNILHEDLNHIWEIEPDDNQEKKNKKNLKNRKFNHTALLQYVLPYQTKHG